MWNVRAFQAACCVLLAFAAPASRGRANPPAGREIYQQTCRSTAWVIAARNYRAMKTGTGFLVDRGRKLLITNYHVVDDVGAGTEAVGVVFPLYEGGGTVAERKQYLRYDRPIRGWVVAADPQRDLAVIELEVVPHAATALPLAGESSYPGERVHLVGNPGASQLLWVHDSGTVHKVAPKTLPDYRTGRPKQALFAEVVPQSPILPGYSGGPVVNVNGELAGVTTLGTLDGTRAWAIDVSEVRDVLRIVREHPKAARRLLDPRSPADYQARAAYYRLHGRPDRATAYYDEVLRHEPKNARAYQGRGAAYARQEAYDKAIADFTAALRLEPENSLAYYNRGLAYAQKGAPDQAIADFTAVLRLDPKNGLAYLDRSEAYSRKGADDQAIADLTALLRLDARSVLAYLQRGQVYRRQGASQQALADFRKAVEINPKDILATSALAWLRATCPDAKVRDGKKAVAYAARACELSAWKNPAMLDTLAAAYAEWGRFEEAVRWQKRAVELAQEPETAKLRSRLSLYEAGKPYRER